MLVIAGLGFGCDNGPTELDRALQSVAIVDGDDQSGIVGKQLSEPLLVRAENAEGEPIPGQVLNFRVVSGGGSVFAGAAQTNADGIVQELWTLGTSTSELQRVEVRAVDPATGEPIVFATFEATPLPDVATTLAKSAGDGQQAVAGTAVTDSLAVLATDQYGNVVPGVSVTWTAASGTVNLATSTTGASGVARTRWTLGTEAGVQSATATVAGLAGSPVAFTATGIAGSAARLAVTIAPDTVRNNVVWPQQPRVQLQDQHDNSVSQSGVTVTIELTSGGGTLNGSASAVTGSDGVASFAGLAIAGVHGSRTLTFRSTGLTDVSMDLELVGGIPHFIVPGDGNNQSAEAGSPVADGPQVRVLDVYSNPVGGATVTFAVASGGGSITNATQVTDADGLARVGSWTLGTSGGVNTLSASAPGSNGTVTGTVTAEAWLPFLAESVVAGRAHTCGRSVDGDAFCWGSNVTPGNRTGGQLGINDSQGFRLIPTPVDGGVTFASIFAGESHTCALTAAGVAYCWGFNFQGQLGDGTIENKHAPVAVATTERFQTLALSASHTCGLNTAGKAFCWGWNNLGQLGNGTTTRSSTPVAVSGDRTFVSIVAAGDRVSFDDRVFNGHTCALTSDGTPFCWGSNVAGQLGNNVPAQPTGPDSRLTPDEVAASGRKFQSIAAGVVHTCAIDVAGAAYCWGSNSFGQLGTGATSNTAQRTPIAATGGHSYQAVVAANRTICALATSGSVYCWGSNTSGQFGNGEQPNVAQVTPTLSANSMQLVKVTLGWQHACGITSDATAYCWGINSFGALGDSSTERRLLPVKVHGPND
jgi:alpha-tubulin suppressor-like RCC1 family protein